MAAKRQGLVDLAPSIWKCGRMQWTETDKPLKFIQNHSIGRLCHEPETIKPSAHFG